MFSLYITTICVSHQGSASSMNSNMLEFISEEEADIAYEALIRSSFSYHSNAKVTRDVIKLY
jgi:hypothetical protein